MRRDDPSYGFYLFLLLSTASMIAQVSFALLVGIEATVETVVTATLLSWIPAMLGVWAHWAYRRMLTRLRA